MLRVRREIINWTVFIIFIHTNRPLASLLSAPKKGSFGSRRWSSLCTSLHQSISHSTLDGRMMETFQFLNRLVRVRCSSHVYTKFDDKAMQAAALFAHESALDCIGCWFRFRCRVHWKRIFDVWSRLWWCVRDFRCVCESRDVFASLAMCLSILKLRVQLIVASIELKLALSVITSKLAINGNQSLSSDTLSMPRCSRIFPRLLLPHELSSLDGKLEKQKNCFPAFYGLFNPSLVARTLSQSHRWILKKLNHFAISFPTLIIFSRSAKGGARLWKN